MVAISLYRGELHKPSNAPRQWLMPTPQISFKHFKLLLRRRSLALSRLPPAPASTSTPDVTGNNECPNPDPTYRPDTHGSRASQDTTSMDSFIVADPTAKDAHASSEMACAQSGQVSDRSPAVEGSGCLSQEKPYMCYSPNSLAIETSVMVDLVNEREEGKRDVQEKLKFLNTRKHNLVKLLKQVLNAVEESKRRSPVGPLRADAGNGPGSSHRPAPSVPACAGPECASLQVHPCHVGSLPYMPVGPTAKNAILSPKL